MKKSCLAIVLALAMSHVQALSCGFKEYWQDESTQNIYFGFGQPDSSAESIVKRNVLVKPSLVSFKGLQSRDFAQDENHVYLFGSMILRANPKTWQKVNNLSNGRSVAALFSKDDKLLYFKYETLIHDGDLATIEVFDQHFSRDKKSLYFNGYRLDNINPNTFKALSWQWYGLNAAWLLPCVSYPDTYIDEATAGEYALSNQKLTEQYGPWRKQK